MRTILLTLSTLLVAGLLHAGDRFPAISHSDLVQAIEAGTVTVVDVNGTASYTEQHITGAIDFAASEDFAAALPTDKTALIVAYCANERCGAWKRAATAAAELGYTNVKHYSPGIAGWKAQQTTAKTSGCDNCADKSAAACAACLSAQPTTCPGNSAAACAAAPKDGQAVAAVDTAATTTCSTCGKKLASE